MMQFGIWIGFRSWGFWPSNHQRAMRIGQTTNGIQVPGLTALDHLLLLPVLTNSTAFPIQLSPVQPTVFNLP